MSSTYNDLKNDVKCWERMFQRQHQRKPTKVDIKAAAPEIQQCYKDYVTLKKEIALKAATSTGVDIFGSDLNKPKEVVSEQSSPKGFVVITPNLRKKIELKSVRKPLVPSVNNENTILKDLGLDSRMQISDNTGKRNEPSFHRTTKSFSNRSASIRKAVEAESIQQCSDKLKTATGTNQNEFENEEPSLNFQAQVRAKKFSSTTVNSEPLTKESLPPAKKSVSHDEPAYDVFDLREEGHNPKEFSSQSLPVPSGDISNSGELKINEELLSEQGNAPKKRKLDRSPVHDAKADDGNFVRLNMRSKKYRRPGKSMTGEAHKRQQWKSRGLFGKGPPKDWKNPNKKPPPPAWVKTKNSKPGKCYKCDQEGHWANKCPGIKPPELKEVTPEERAAQEALDFTSLEPMIQMGRIAGASGGGEGGAVTGSAVKACPPLLDGSEEEEEVERLLSDGLRDLGYPSFRPGQREAVLRILQGKSTLLVLSTGSGKSLVYQLASYLHFKKHQAITLVISPLISLMDDQMQSLPAALLGRCIHSHLSAKQKTTLKEDISGKRVPLLLLSPEALMGGNYGALPKDLPPIAFVCIDEAHCLSSWSDNFRPAYLRVCDMLRDKYGVRCFLGLTATCTTASSTNVCKFIGVDPDEGVLKGPVIRDNLYMTVSADDDRDRALISLLGGERFKDLGSIIVYCTRRQQCERVAALLRMSLPPWAPEDHELTQDKNKGKRKRKALENSTSESYHAGLTPAQRSRVQYHFMAGTLRIVCATVAFGMGLDKANVRSVIHYSMPKSFENYVQETGRAGRDGRPAHCHIFVDELGGDLAELSKHAHSNTVDRYSVQVLLKNIFKPCACATLAKLKGTKDKADKESVDNHVESETKDENEDEFDEVDVDWDAVDKTAADAIKCPGHSVTFPIAKLVSEVDVPEENISTMLTYLELAPSRCWMKLKRPVNATCSILCYGGAAHLTALAKQATTVLAAMKFYSDSSSPTNELTFPYIELAARMGWDAFIVRRELRDLEKRVIPGFKVAVMVEFTDLSFHVHAPGNLSDDEMDEVTDYLHMRVLAQKNAEVRRLRDLHKALLEVSCTTHYDAAHEVDTDKDAQLKKHILRYFTVSAEQELQDWQFVAPNLPPAAILSVVQRDIRTFIFKHNDLPLRGRVIARIFQGIGSPNYPSMTWGRVKQFWRRHIDVDFDWMVRSATEEIAKVKLGL